MSQSAEVCNRNGRSPARGVLPGMLNACAEVLEQVSIFRRVLQMVSDMEEPDARQIHLDCLVSDQLAKVCAEVAQRQL